MNLREKTLKGLKLDDTLVIATDAHYVRGWLDKLSK